LIFKCGSRSHDSKPRKEEREAEISRDDPLPSVTSA
jgi:hypothetical protein